MNMKYLNNASEDISTKHYLVHLTSFVATYMPVHPYVTKTKHEAIFLTKLFVGEILDVSSRMDKPNQKVICLISI